MWDSSLRRFSLFSRKTSECGSSELWWTAKVEIVWTHFLPVKKTIYVTFFWRVWVRSRLEQALAAPGVGTGGPLVLLSFDILKHIAAVESILLFDGGLGHWCVLSGRFRLSLLRNQTLWPKNTQLAPATSSEGLVLQSGAWELRGWVLVFFVNCRWYKIFIKIQRLMNLL